MDETTRDELAALTASGVPLEVIVDVGAGTHLYRPQSPAERAELATVTEEAKTAGVVDAAPLVEPAP